MNHRKWTERTGAWFAVLSAIMFGTMPFLAKIAYSCGFNSYFVAFGRFLSGAAGAWGSWRRCWDCLCLRWGWRSAEE